MFSCRKIQSKVRETVVVPAPEEPVTAMMGWRADMAAGSAVGLQPAQPLVVECGCGGKNDRLFWQRCRLKRATVKHAKGATSFGEGDCVFVFDPAGRKIRYHKGESIRL